MRPWRFSLLMCAGFAALVPARAASLAECAAIDEARRRLACYDEAVGRTERAPEAPAPAARPADREPAPPAPDRRKSYLTDSWHLDERDELGITRIQVHRPTYILARRTNNANVAPASPAPGHSTRRPRDFEQDELEMQVSLKTELLAPRYFPGHNTRLWFAYTQQAWWQAANRENSSPFRENNYEPELILTWANPGRDASSFKLLNVGIFSHQSNGQSGPDSRSWNRSYIQGGWEWGDFSVLARAWRRWPESAANDDNPDLADYVGRGDAVLHWRLPHDWRASLLARHNLRQDHGRGYAQLDLATGRILGTAARLHFHLTSGYGESLIDYNHKQRTVGVGLSFGDW
jgi:phospholipase A1/A2